MRTMLWKYVLNFRCGCVWTPRCGGGAPPDSSFRVAHHIYHHQCTNTLMHHQYTNTSCATTTNTPTLAAPPAAPDITFWLDIATKKNSPNKLAASLFLAKKITSLKPRCRKLEHRRCSVINNYSN